MVVKRKDSKNRVLKEGEYQKANGIYEFRWRSPNGKRHSIYDSDLTSLRKKEEGIIKDVMDGISSEDGCITLNQLFEKWILLKSKIKKSTKARYKADYDRIIRPNLGEIKIKEINSSMIWAFYNMLHDDLNYETASVGTIHRILHQILGLAVEDEILRKNPSESAYKNFKAGTDADDPKSKALTAEEQRIFEEYLKNSRYTKLWYPTFTVMLWTGLRAGELSALTWSDIDFKSKTIHVQHGMTFVPTEDGKKTTPIISTPKTKCSIRTIPMLPIVEQALKTEKKNQKALGIKCTVEISGFTDFVFLTKTGMPKRVWGMNDALDNIVKDCNQKILMEWKINPTEQMPVILPPISCHWLRHSFATRCVEAGINPKALQAILGHRDLATTMDLYAEATEQLKQAEIITLDTYLNKQKRLESKQSG